MILTSTVRKLQASNATIYKVTVPAHTGRIGVVEKAIPEYVEHFASLKGAEAFVRDGWPVVTGAKPFVIAVPAREFDPWTMR